MQQRAFRGLLEKYRDYETNPGAEQPERTLRKLQMQGSDYFFLAVDGRKAGAIRIQHNAGSCRISPMYLLPEEQGKGYAQKAILAAEARYPGVKRWELETIRQESKLCYLYEKLGYRPTGREEPLKEGMTLVFYEKIISHWKG